MNVLFLQKKVSEMLMRREKIDAVEIEPEEGITVLPTGAQLEAERIALETKTGLDAALETISILQKRLTELEVLTHNLNQQGAVAREALERQTRHSALQLAIAAAGPGAGAAIIPIYNQFLPILRGTLH